MSQQNIKTPAQESSETCSKKQIVVDQVVYTNLYNMGRGIVFAINGEQLPETIRAVLGVRMTGGSAKFDIVFESGHITNQLPECILHGVQWKILDEIVSPCEVERILSSVTDILHCKEKEKQEAKRVFDSEVERLKTDQKYKELSQIIDGHQVAKNIKEVNYVFTASIPGAISSQLYSHSLDY